MKNKLRNYRKKSLITSVCLLITILVISCSTKKITTSAVRQENYRHEKTVDSTVTKQIFQEITTQQVPEQRAQASVLIAAIENLPAGAKFTEKSGRASVELHRTGDTIIITAICDSLQRLIYNYELSITNYERKIEQKNSEIKSFETEYKKTKYGFSVIAIFIIGAAVGFIVGGLLSKKKSVIETILNFIKTIFK